jgi:hypothetical protein
MCPELLRVDLQDLASNAASRCFKQDGIHAIGMKLQGTVSKRVKTHYVGP